MLQQSSIKPRLWKVPTIVSARDSFLTAAKPFAAAPAEALEPAAKRRILPSEQAEVAQARVPAASGDVSRSQQTITIPCEHSHFTDDLQRLIKVSFVGASARIAAGTTFIFGREPY